MPLSTSSICISSRVQRQSTRTNELLLLLQFIQQQQQQTGLSKHDLGFWDHIFLWKMKWCFPIGFLFGLKYSCSNIGLKLVPARTHLLLQSSDLVWTVLGAYIINKERSSTIEIRCLAGCVILSWQLLFDKNNNNHNNESSVVVPFFAIAINLVSPVLLGLCLATLRLACTELMRPDNRVGTVSSVELTSIKLIVSSFVELIFACIMEQGDNTKDSWWVAFIELEQSTRFGVIGGAFLVSTFQVNCTFLTFLTSAVSLGLVGQVKIIPQWVVASIFGVGIGRPTNTTSLMGAILIMSSAAAFAISNFTSNDTRECDKDKQREVCWCWNDNANDKGKEEYDYDSTNNNNNFERKDVSIDSARW